MSIILQEIKDSLANIRANGILVNNTKELQNVITKFYPHRMNLLEEEKSIEKLYNEKIGSWNNRQLLEKDHYNFLSSFLIHKLKEIQYFFNLKPDDFSSRKNIIWSSDCIGCIQILIRENKTFLNIFVRSSDALNLLPADYLFGCKLLDIVLDRFDLHKNTGDVVTFFVTSSHYYLKDSEKIDTILGDKTLEEFRK